MGNRQESQEGAGRESWGHLTLDAWMQSGGCGLSHESIGMVNRATASCRNDWGSRLTLAELEDIYPLVGREIRRFLAEQSRD